MAQDNDDDTRPPPPDQPRTYEVFDGSTTTAGRGQGQQQQQQQQGQPVLAKPTFREGVQSIKADDFFSVHRIPCAREGLMTGIGAGAVVGVGRFVAGARAPKAANWAFGAFVLGSVVQWEYCQVQRRKERATMARVVEVIDRKQAEKKAQAEEAAQARREAAEKARREAERRWYKFW